MSITRRTSLAVAGWSCAALCVTKGVAAQRGVEKTSFGKVKGGQAVDSYTLRNSSGTEAVIITYGARVRSLKCPDASGKIADIVLGFDDIEGYQGENPYFGAIVGRYGNRIAKGKFTLDGKTYTLARNNGENALHGGLKGFDKVLWQAKEVTGSGSPAVELTYVSKDGEEGYPGTLRATIRYALTDDGELKIDYEASSDKSTVVNLTNHSYFNLAGEGSGDILGHRIRIDADRFTPVDAGLIPTGELKSVAGTPFDFRQGRPIGERIAASDEQIVRGKGYDHNFVLNGYAGRLRKVVRVTEPKSGRVLEVSTTEPGVQFYTGNFLDGSVRGKGGKAYGHRGAFCLETQHFPDSPNQPSFPSTVLTPGKIRKSSTMYKMFSEKSV